jgi:hypothetical protein
MMAQTVAAIPDDEHAQRKEASFPDRPVQPVLTDTGQFVRLVSGRTDRSVGA